MKQHRALLTNPLFPTALFFVIGLIGILNHELWLDEAHHWLLARDSDSIPALIENTRYEGHPILWNLLLFFVSRFTWNPFWMQLVHIGIASWAVYVFLRYAPFNTWIKWLFVFGYFTLYEYHILSRNYSLGVLFLFMACSVYPYRKEKFLLLAFILALCCNTHAIFIIPASGLMLLMTIEHLRPYGMKGSNKFKAGIAVFLIGALLAVGQILPPADTIFFNRIKDIPLGLRMANSVTPLLEGFVPVPNFGSIHFWNSHIILDGNRLLGGICTFLSFFIPVLLFYKHKILLAYVYVCALGGFLFFFTTQISAARYSGVFFLVIISALWLEQYHRDDTPKMSALADHTLGKLKKGIVYGLLGVHCFAGLFALGVDLANPFTNAQKASNFLQESGLSGKVIATNSCEGSALSSYLQKPVYFTSTGRFQSFCVWNASTLKFSKEKDAILKSLMSVLSAENESIIYILPRPEFSITVKEQWIKIDDGLQYRFLEKFENSIVKSGNYYIYEVSKS